MQVFDVYTYNLKKIKFRENKDYFDRLLGELDLKYTDMGFCFRSDIDDRICTKVVKMLPNLNQYRKTVERTYTAPEYELSSISVEDKGVVSLHIDRKHTDDLDKLLKKVPRPVNFNFMGVILDNIDWYGSFGSEPCFTRDYEGKVSVGYDFSNYFSNSIRFIKDFDYGNKLNLVRVLIDRTSDFDNLKPIPRKFEEFCDCLGKPISKETVCVFDDEKNERLQLAGTFLKELTDTARYNDLFIEFSRNYPDNVQGITQKSLDSFLSIKGYSPKNLFKSIGILHGFRYAGYAEGRYELQKVNVNNHKIKVIFFIRPFSSVISAEIYVGGYNFNLFVAELPTVIVGEELQIESYAQKVFEVADMIENEFSEKLFSAYGKTPDWYDK